MATIIAFFGPSLFSKAIINQNIDAGHMMKSGLASYIKSSKTPRLDCECLAWIEEKLRELKDLAGPMT